MPYIATEDGVQLYYEDEGDGSPVVFVHEFAGDYRSWEPQVKDFCSRGYRCITFNARGYPPSDVPDSLSSYSQARAYEDVAAVVDGLGLKQAHFVGLSMGGFAILHLALQRQDWVRSLVLAGCGYGADPERQEQFRSEAEATARMFEELGIEKAASHYAAGPTRVQFQNKDPQGWESFARMLSEHSAKGSALTFRGVQKERPSLWSFAEALRRLNAPTLILAGDEDDPCLETSIFLKRTIPTAGLSVIPKSGHTLNLEEPNEFNRTVAAFLEAVEAGDWFPRDPRSLKGSLLGLAPQSDED